MSVTPRSRIAVFSLGGTIAMLPGQDGAVIPALTGTELLSAVPGLDRLPVDLEVHDFRRVPGAALSFADVLDLAAAIRAMLPDAGGAGEAGRVEAGRHAGAGVGGVVVSQGTDTIEETAFLLDLVLDTSTPVVITGAMRHPSLAGADGPGNLLAAIRTAASADARDLGCLVVMSDQIHAARWVRKIHTSSTAAFMAPNHGPLGHVVEGNVDIPVRIDRIGRLGGHGGSGGGGVPGLGGLAALADSGGDPGVRRTVRVGLATVALGDDGDLLTAMGERADGLVVAGFGVGHVPAATVPALRRLAERIPVVLASRTGAGSVHATTYGFPGSERDLQEHGLISAGYLDPVKARILLYALLAAGTGREQITAAFETIGHAHARTGER
jgi:L-asparaginase